MNIKILKQKQPAAANTEVNTHRFKINTHRFKNLNIKLK